MDIKDEDDDLFNSFDATPVVGSSVGDRASISSSSDDKMRQVRCESEEFGIRFGVRFHIAHNKSI